MTSIALQIYLLKLFILLNKYKILKLNLSLSTPNIYYFATNVDSTLLHVIRRAKIGKIVSSL